MRARLDEQDVAGILDASALEAYASAMPSDMVPETEVTRLYAALRARLDRETARRIARDAGRRTAGYVLTHRIPHFAQGLFPALPRPLGRRALMLAIRANAWTFAGSARIRQHLAARLPDLSQRQGQGAGLRLLCGYVRASLPHAHRPRVSSRRSSVPGGGRARMRLSDRHRIGRSAANGTALRTRQGIARSGANQAA